MLDPRCPAIKRETSRVCIWEFIGSFRTGDETKSLPTKVRQKPAESGASALDVEAVGAVGGVVVEDFDSRAS